MKTSVNVKIGQTSYEVSYPNVGEKLQIENVKLLLTNDNYGDLARSGHITAIEMLDLVDAVSYFTILIPEIKSTLKYEDFLSMEVIRARDLRKAFKKSFRPFLEEIDRELNSEDDESEETAEA